MSSLILEPEGVQLYYFDVGKLVETMNQKFEGQGITGHPFTPLKVRWYQNFLAGLSKRNIDASGKYELSHIIDAYVPNRERRFGRIRIERGVLDQHGANYERVILDTFKPINLRNLRGNGGMIPQTQIDICVMGFDEEYRTGYDMTRRDKHAQVKEMLPTTWFLRSDALEYLVENGKLR